MEVVVIVGGGNGRSVMEDCCFFLEMLCFLGIPGKCSQENGTPENLSGEAGLK